MKMRTIIMSLILIFVICGITDANPSKNYLDKGNEYYKEGRYEDAIAEYKKAIDEEPDNFLAWENLGWAYWRLGNAQETDNIWNNILKFKKNDCALLNKIANFYVSNNRLKLAVPFYERSLSLNPEQKNISLNLAKAYRDTRDYEKAYSFTKTLSQKYPDSIEAKIVMAQVLTGIGRYDDAQKIWKELADREKDIAKYKVGLAKVLYYRGEYQEAEGVIDRAAKEDSKDIDALRLAARYSLNRKDYSKAKTYLSKVVEMEGANIFDLARFADSCIETQDHKTAIKACDRAIAMPDAEEYKGDIFILRGNANLMDNNMIAAVNDFKKARSLSPNNINALRGLYLAYLSANRYNDALKVLDEIGTINPPDYDFEVELDTALIYAYKGDFKKAIDILYKLKEIGRWSMVPVLLYHGIDEKRGGLGIYLDTFEEHMKALKNEGYQAISLKELLKAKGLIDYMLPEKSIIITFDDGRRDSFKLADPILEKFGFKAVMLYPIKLTEGNPYVYLTYKELNDMVETGRWEVGSHGLEAHGLVVIDSKGNRGDFLTNKIWLKDEERLESDEEFILRLERDYKDSKEILEKQVPRADIIAYAFPGDNFGQLFFPNTKDAKKLNLELPQRYYKIIFHHSRYAYNLIYDKTPFMKRLKVSPSWSADRLITELTPRPPSYKANLYLGNIYVWMGKYKEAEAFYNSISQEEKRGELYIGKGRIGLSKGDLREAKLNFEQALAIDPSNDVAKEMLSRIKHLMRPFLLPEFKYFEDDRHRRRLAQVYDLNYYLNESLAIFAGYENTYLKERGFIDIRDNAWKAGITIKKNDNEYIGGGAIFRSYSGVDRNDLFYFGDIGLVVGDYVKINAYHSRDYVNTVWAITSGIKIYKNSVSCDVRLNDYTRSRVVYDYSTYSDNNYRHYINFGLYTDIIKSNPRLTIGYGLLYGDSKFDPDAYYTSRNLFVQEARMSISVKMNSLTIREDYNVGYGREASQYRFSQTTSTSFVWKLANDLEFFSDFTYLRLPDYKSQGLNVGAKIRF